MWVEKCADKRKEIYSLKKQGFYRKDAIKKLIMERFG